jgi:hypothetical protein
MNKVCIAFAISASLALASCGQAPEPVTQKVVDTSGPALAEALREYYDPQPAPAKAPKVVVYSEIRLPPKAKPFVVKVTSKEITFEHTGAAKIVLEPQVGDRWGCAQGNAICAKELLPEEQQGLALKALADSAKKVGPVQVPPPPREAKS